MTYNSILYPLLTHAQYVYMYVYYHRPPYVFQKKTGFCSEVRRILLGCIVEDGTFRRLGGLDEPMHMGVRAIFVTACDILPLSAKG